VGGMSATVYVLPAPAPVLLALRAEIGQMAKRHRADEQQRRHAVTLAIRELEDGASVAWALHIARRALRPVWTVRHVPYDGDSAA